MSEDTSAYWRKLLELDKPLPFDPVRKYRAWYAFWRPFFFFLFEQISNLIFPVRARGLKNLKIKPPFILASNHTSTLDYSVLMLKVPRELSLRFFAQAARDYYDNALARFFMRSFTNVIRVDRMGDFFPALRAAAQVLRAGESIYIAPEAARSGSGELLPFKVGIGVLAVELNVPVIPAYIRGTHEIMPIGVWWPKKGMINITFGEPLYPTIYIEKKKSLQAYDVYKEFTEELRRRIVELSKLPY